MTPDSSSGILYCIATPIGNRADISQRAVEAFQECAHVACEDTRSAGRLLAHLGIAGKHFISLFEHNEERRINGILALLERGEDVALVSEAGTPTISDPGYRLVAACAQAGLRVVPIPGACAAVAALSASGLPTDRFLFLGFPPRKGGKLTRFLTEALEPGRTSILYLPARRLADILGRVHEMAPDARVVVARELTKTYEEFLRGTPAELQAEIDRRQGVKGECTVLFYVLPARKRAGMDPTT